MWSCNVRASNSCSFVATATASRSLRAPSPTNRLRLSNRVYLDPARHEKKCSSRNECLMKRCELGRAQDRRLQHEIFLEKIGVLDHRALERLENYASFAELFRNDISFQKLIARENQARGYFIKSIGLLEDRSAGLIRNGAAKFERREIEQIDIGKPPRLIFTRWSRG